MTSQTGSIAYPTQDLGASAALLELAERCEKAEGPDREIDLAIHRLIDPIHVGFMDRENERLTAVITAMGPDAMAHRLPGLRDDTNCSPHYTASLDAAMTLVPAEMRDEIEITTLYQIARVGINLNHGPDDGPHYGSNECNSIPLAICAAALRARANAPNPTPSNQGITEQPGENA